MMTGNSYAGIGSRKTPSNVLADMVEIGSRLAQMGLILRSGGAEGADTAFENGALRVQGSQTEIFVPWKGFRPLRGDIVMNDPRAREIAQTFYTSGPWVSTSEGVKKLMSRNVHQILGKGLDDPVKFVVCWTQNGEAIGGTGLALRLAESRNIPVFNLFHGYSVEDVMTKVRDLEKA